MKNIEKNKLKTFVEGISKYFHFILGISGIIIGSLVITSIKKFTEINEYEDEKEYINNVNEFNKIVNNDENVTLKQKLEKYEIAKKEVENAKLIKDETFNKIHLKAIYNAFPYSEYIFVGEGKLSNIDFSNKQEVMDKTINFQHNKIPFWMLNNENIYAKSVTIPKLKYSTPYLNVIKNSVQIKKHSFTIYDIYFGQGIFTWFNLGEVKSKIETYILPLARQFETQKEYLNTINELKVKSQDIESLREYNYKLQNIYFDYNKRNSENWDKNDLKTNLSFYKPLIYKDLEYIEKIIKYFEKPFFEQNKIEIKRLNPKWFENDLGYVDPLKKGDHPITVSFKNYLIKTKNYNEKLVVFEKEKEYFDNVEKINKTKELKTNINTYQKNNLNYQIRSFEKIENDIETAKTAGSICLSLTALPFIVIVLSAFIKFFKKRKE